MILASVINPLYSTSLAPPPRSRRRPRRRLHGRICEIRCNVFYPLNTYSLGVAYHLAKLFAYNLFRGEYGTFSYERAHPCANETKNSAQIRARPRTTFMWIEEIECNSAP
jgi:hypothetical protein